MPPLMNKRQQARNEQALQKLILDVAGNDRCADCQARNPGWTSWNLGIFLCMRCAALHRKMGTHISKVKSLSMDTWATDQVENMKRVGNTASNRVFNPRNIKPTIPVDSDEADNAMERFIREKYQHRTLANGPPSLPVRHNTGSTSSSDHRAPPPLPPKDGPRFGLNVRSTSSQYPSGGSADVTSRTASSKTSSDNLRSSRSTLDLKLQQLKDMGFLDSARNATILKGVDGNVQRAVEALVRMGESTLTVNGLTVAKRQAQAAAQEDVASSAQITQQTSVPQQWPDQRQTQPNVQAQTPSTASDFPSTFQYAPAPAAVQAQTSVTSFNPFEQVRSPVQSSNPFDHDRAPPAVTPSLQQPFQNLQVSPQPLLPHNTGNLHGQPLSPTNPFLASPQYSGAQGQVPQQMPNAFQAQFPSPFQQQQQQQPAPQMHHANPFLRASRSQTFAPSNPFGQPARAQTFDVNVLQNNNSGQQTFGNGYGLQPLQQHAGQSPIYQSPLQSPQPTGTPQSPFSPTTYPPMHQSQQSQPVQPAMPQASQQPYQQQQQQQQQQSIPGQQTSFVATSIQQPPFQTALGHEYGQQPHAAPVMPQYTGRFDKSSILALYSQPHLAPTRPPQPSIPEEGELTYHSGTQQSHQAPQRSVTMPTDMPTTSPPQQALASNPFASLALPINAMRPASRGHLSKESADVAALMGGRHSPDAFAGLSARAGRY